MNTNWNQKKSLPQVFFKPILSCFSPKTGLYHKQMTSVVGVSIRLLSSSGEWENCWKLNENGRKLRRQL